MVEVASMLMELAMRPRLQILGCRAQLCFLQEHVEQPLTAGELVENGLTIKAKKLFDDPEFADLFHKGLYTKLQTTKEGATDKSRIVELAGRWKNILYKIHFLFPVL